MLRASTLLSPAGGGRYVGLPSERGRAAPATPRSRPRAPSLVPIAPAVRAPTIDRSSKDGARLCRCPLMNRRQGSGVPERWRDCPGRVAPSDEPDPPERPRSRPPERQVARLSPLGRGLGLVAGAGPVGPGAAPVVGALGGP